jgi:anti-anti-sigma factor
MSSQDWSDNIKMVDLLDDPEFTDELNSVTEEMEGQPKDVVLNLAQVKFLNSSNISRLLKLRKVLIDRKCRLVLCAIPIQVWGVFLLTGLDTLFDVAEDTASALATLQLNT